MRIVDSGGAGYNVGMPVQANKSEKAAPNIHISVPSSPVVAAGLSRTVWLLPDGEVIEIPIDEAARRIVQEASIVCYRPGIARRLGVRHFEALDVLELIAFVRPAEFCLPTPAGIADALALTAPQSLEDSATTLYRAAEKLLLELTGHRNDTELVSIALSLAASGWNWGPSVLAALDLNEPPVSPETVRDGLSIWERLPEWEDRAPPPPPYHAPVSPQEAESELDRLLGPGAEIRPQQRAYTQSVAPAFAPPESVGEPNIVLAEAGTGVGKTLGYISPAGIWASRNGGTVWLSTYTKNLQRQIDQELDKLFPDPSDKLERAVVRKGRENYLCLLNFEEEASRAGLGAGGIALGLMARWAMASRDGDMVGGDFPAWLSHLFGSEHTIGLTDRRGECVYSACPHYRRCFIEIVQRKAQYADLVIANHALVMIQAAMAGDERELPSRYVFDEGHHLFDAADSAFSAHLGGLETAELRHWIRGAEGRRRRRARGLERRIADLISEDEDGAKALAAAVRAAAALPESGWLGRVDKSEPHGPTEAFLVCVRDHVRSRQTKTASGYSLESDTTHPTEELSEAAGTARAALLSLVGPLVTLTRHLAERLDAQSSELDTATRVRIEAAGRSLRRRTDTLRMWCAMLEDIGGEPPETFIDWFDVNRSNGRVIDIGMRRHWLDPTIPFAESVLSRAHGAVITSASLRDQNDHEDEDWIAAEIRTGANHLALPARRSAVSSPFDYGQQTRVLIVSDVRREDPDQVSAAYRELFLAADGGALGLFTAIARMRQVRANIAEALESAGLPLYAQHVDAIDTSTLVDIFRAEIDSCLLGTDAVRDGVDVPGESLRLIVFDRVPWPRPDIVHKARRSIFGGNRYDDMITRLRLKQAYGRLVRRATDRGVFVLLDRMTPTRLLDAFPDDVNVERVGLAEAVDITRDFLAPAG
tara:strand:+ start:4477 stop:7278 length:2802 start_codon:yes stop_codon:yes gene_type:complete